MGGGGRGGAPVGFEPGARGSTGLLAGGVRDSNQGRSRVEATSVHLSPLSSL